MFALSGTSAGATASTSQKLTRRGFLVCTATLSMADALLHARPSADHGLPRGDGTSNDDVCRSADQLLAGSVNKLKLSTPDNGQTTAWPASGDRGAYLYVPPTYQPEQPSPLLVMLHGAGGYAKNTLMTFGALHVFDAEKCLLLVPESRGTTWDVIRGGFGPDVPFIDSALQHVFQRYNIDTSRCGLAGFSDGASYALSLGLPNGDLFSHIIAFSPGFMRPPKLIGSPKVYISHGVYDEILSINLCSRRLLPRLSKMLPYCAELEYVEFNGGHSVTSRVASQALSWFLQGTPIDNSTFAQGPHVPE